MKIQITWGYLVAFLALNMVMGELHEQVHISVGYWICGCYGPRDISTWRTCDNCSNGSIAFLATAAGPLFSCLLMWVGACLFRYSESGTNRSIGFSLLFANLPFARVFTALVGGGDEKVVIHHLLGENIPIIFARLAAVIIVSLVCIPPVLMVAKKLMNKRRWLIISAFLILPLIYGIIFQRLLLNKLLEIGIGTEVNFFGTPNLVLIHFAFMLLILLLLRKRLVHSFAT